MFSGRVMPDDGRKDTVVTMEPRREYACAVEEVTVALVRLLMLASTDVSYGSIPPLSLRGA